RRALREQGTIYAIDQPLLRGLRPDVILTQKLCDVCAVGYGTVAGLAETLPGPPRITERISGIRFASSGAQPRHLSRQCECLLRTARAAHCRQHRNSGGNIASERISRVCG